MSEAIEAAPAAPSGLRAYWVLLALVAGLIGGALVPKLGDAVREPALASATMIGGLWLNALKMTVIPLMVALLVTGIARGAEVARAGRIAGRSVAWFVALCTASAVFGAIVMPLLLKLFPLSGGSAEALRAGLATIDNGTASGPIPSLADFYRSIIPSNVFAAASNGDILPLVVFALLFALALTRIGRDQRAAVVKLFEGIGDALLVVVDWVLWIAPLGVASLAFTVGAGAGTAAFAGLTHYIALVSGLGILMTLAGLALIAFVARIGPLSFAKTTIAPQAVAISTQSSLASLPAMLVATRRLGVDEEVADVTLPLSVALFRATGPAMNLAVPIYIAHWLGIEFDLSHLIAATSVAAVASYGAVSLPGQISFFTSIAPIAMALGVPVAPLALLVAVEMVPDIFRTVGNVVMDVAVTTAVDRSVKRDGLSAQTAS